MEVNKNKIKWSMSVFKLYKITLSIENSKRGILTKKKLGCKCDQQASILYWNHCSKDTINLLGFTLPCTIKKSYI